jgi:protein-L-isoaspartate(D-aspartate) O-methyltransferase
LASGTRVVSIAAQAGFGAFPGPDPGYRIVFLRLGRRSCNLPIFLSASSPESSQPFVPRDPPHAARDDGYNRRVKAVIMAMLFIAGAAVADDDRAPERSKMVAQIAALAVQTGAETTRTRLDSRVMDAMGRVARHRFVPADQAPYAYENRPLPIGYGQTISQPYIVALMTDLMNARPGDKVLEIGTGSGYQAAILAELGAKVFTIEIVEPLGTQAAERLKQSGYKTVTVRVGDGYYGWKEQAPFDAIIITAAASHIPPPLVQQLNPGGRMVIPVGSAFLTQHLMLVEKAPDGSVTSQQILPVRFVPLTGAR